MNVEEMLERHFQSERAVHDFFGYKEDWVKISLESHLDDNWILTERSVMWSPVEVTEETIEAGDEIYTGAIYTQRFLPKWVYETDTHTMISVDTRTDGNKFLMVFDNSKRVRDQKLVHLFEECWG